MAGKPGYGVPYLAVDGASSGNDHSRGGDGARCYD